ncbi:hypothetical protein HYZ99_01005 [Candidatus Peregrinibacteria bacterium]|nr:hypothetical protein [Candidatus Peregrinibacteria bacterium]
MADDPTPTATMADIQYLAELITKNTDKIDGLEERIEGVDHDLHDLKETMVAGFTKLDHSIQGISKIVGWHDEKIINLDRHVHALETAA